MGNKKVLIIAEKPSVALTIAKVVRAFDRKDGYVEGNNHVVSWCYGHLVTQYMPSDYDEKYKKWKLENLPIIPDRWGYKAIESSRNQLEVLRALFDRADIDSIVCATDAGREGELIFRNVYYFLGCKKPVKRMWTSSLEEDAIAKALEKMKDKSEYNNLYRAAVVRQRADWIVGMNASPLFAFVARSKGGDSRISVGRVQTPTLKMITDRDKEISDFKSEPFWTIEQKFKEDWTLSSARFKDKEKAREACEKMKDLATNIISVIRNEKKILPPLLFSLNAIQRDANKRYSLSSKQTLDTLQGLYERKLCTYPRTDSTYLTSDMEASVSSLVSSLSAKALPKWKQKRKTGVLINDAKVSDHSAILPTQTYIKDMENIKLSRNEKIIMDMLVLRLLESLSDPFVYNETKVEAECGGVKLTGSFKQKKDEGFRKVSAELRKKDKEDEKKKEIFLPPHIKEGSREKAENIILKAGKTTPPSCYTENSLLGDMEKAGRKEMDEDVERKGLGTSATRASIIERLIEMGYIIREKNGKNTELKSTEKGRLLIGLVTEKLASPSLTAEWENRLLQIERGKESDKKVLDDIEKMMVDIINENKKHIDESVISGERESGVVIGKCPACGKDFVDKGVAYFCSDKSCNTMLFKIKSWNMNDDDASRLIKGEEVHFKNCISKDGKKYECFVKMQNKNGRTKDSNKIELDIRFENKKKKKLEEESEKK